MTRNQQISEGFLEHLVASMGEDTNRVRREIQSHVQELRRLYTTFAGTSHDRGELGRALKALELPLDLLGESGL